MPKKSIKRKEEKSSGNQKIKRKRHLKILKMNFGNEILLSLFWMRKWQKNCFIIREEEKIHFFYIFLSLESSLLKQRKFLQMQIRKFIFRGMLLKTTQEFLEILCKTIVIRCFLMLAHWVRKWRAFAKKQNELFHFVKLQLSLQLLLNH